MKQTIENLKALTDCKSYPKLAEFLGVSKMTIYRLTDGKNVTLNRTLPMLDYLLSDLSETKLRKFLNKFKEKE